MSDAEVLAQFRKQDLAKNQLNEEIKKIQVQIS